MISNKTALLLVGILFLTGSSFAQVIKPAKLAVVPLAGKYKTGDVVELTVTATIDQNWYLYSSGFDPECGPTVMSFTFEKHPSYELVGELVGLHDKTKRDEAFGCDVRYFVGSGTFSQKIRVLSSPLVVKAEYDGQTCSEVNGQCVPLSGTLDFGSLAVSGSPVTQPKTSVTVEPTNTSPTGSAGGVTPVASIDTAAVASASKATNWGDIKGPQLNPELVKDDAAQQSLIGFFILAFIAGLTALLTPCVFPMIPMTVSFFTQGRSKTQAIVYGLSIVLIYTLIGASLAPVMGPETANHLSTEWIPNLIFFTVCLLSS